MTYADFCEEVRDKQPWQQQQFLRTLANDVQKEIFLGFEAAQQPEMDLFYKRQFNCIADRSKAGYLFDAMLRTPKGNTFTVEEKYRTKDWDDFLVEVMQDCTPPLNEGNAKYKLGWFYTETAQRMVYCVSSSFLDPRPTKVYTVRLDLLRANWQELVQELQPAHRFSEKGRGFSLNFAFSWDKLLYTTIEVRGEQIPIAQKFYV